MKKQYKYTIILLVLFLFVHGILFSQSDKDKIATLNSDSTKSTTLDSTVINLSKNDTIIYKNSQQVDNLITYAKKFLGTPYRSAGTTPSGFDCSGFISYIFSNFGISLVHSSYGMAEYGKTVKLSDIRPGDLMFFKGRSVINNFKTSKYYIPRYITTKRLDYGVPLK